MFDPLTASETRHTASSAPTARGRDRHLASPAPRRSRCSVGFIHGLLAATPAPGFAQFPGERVRIGLAAGTVTGVVVETDGGRFRMSIDGGGLRWVATDEIVRAERSLGFRANARNGLVIGAGVGAVLGVTWGLAAGRVCDVVYEDPGAECDRFGDALLATFAIANSVALGLLGLGVGHLIRIEKWELLLNSASSGTVLGPVAGVLVDREGQLKTIIGGRNRVFFPTGPHRCGIP